MGVGTSAKKKLRAGEALVEASRHGDTDLVQTLLKTFRRRSRSTTTTTTTEQDDEYDPTGIDVVAVDKNGRTAMMHACAHGHHGILKLLIRAGADVNAVAWRGHWTALMSAAEHGHVQLVRVLLGAHAQPNAATRLGITALMLAALGGHEETTKVLLEAGACASAVEKRGRTPLMLAAERGHARIVMALLNAGATAEAADEDGWSALYLAVVNRHSGVAAMLLNSADGAAAAEKLCHMKTLLGWTPLMLAADRGDALFVQLLLDQGGGGKEQPSHCSMHRDLYCEEGPSYQRTVLTWAASNGYLDVIRALLNAGWDANGVDGRGETAVMAATSSVPPRAAVAVAAGGGGRGVVSGTSVLHELVSTLMLAGGNLDSVDGAGKTALMRAACANDGSVVELLCAAGADINAVAVGAAAANSSTWTALMFASAGGCVDAARALLGMN